MKTIIARIQGHDVIFSSLDEASIRESAEDGSWWVWAERIAAPRALVKPYSDATSVVCGGGHLRAGSRAELVNRIRAGELACATVLGLLK